MLRVIAEPLFLFLSPFAAYAIFLYLRNLYPFAFGHWTRKTVSSLTLAGLGLALLGMFLLGLFSERHDGAYAPAHIENGRLVPGKMQ
jgi:hypothetical protein